MVVLVAVAAGLENPGELDACYYFHVAENLAAGRGMVEDVVWNYLDRSEVALSLPHPSHLYWMPLTSWLAWLGIEAFGWLLPAFRAAQVPFVFLASLVPPLAGWIAAVLWARLDRVVVAAVLALALPSYLRAWVVPEPAAPFCVAAAGVFLACARASAGGPAWLWAVAGAAAGAAHLARADGALVVVVAGGLSLTLREPDGERRWRRALAAALLVASGYLLVITPWLVRNLRVIGSPLPQTVPKTSWLVSYDDIFAYHAALGPSAALARGAAALVVHRARAALDTVAHFASIFQWALPPLAVLGLWRAEARGRKLLRPSAIYAVLLLSVMALVFPYPAQYGSLFRAGAALIPWGAALVPEGLGAVARRYARLRGMDAAPMERFFERGVTAALLAVSVLFHVNHLKPLLPQAVEPWNERHAHYLAIERWLTEQGAVGPVLVVNPPGYTLATSRPSIVIPSDGASAIAAAAERFGARWMILESNVPSQRSAWETGAAIDGFTHVKTFRDGLGMAVRVYAREPD